MVKNEKVWGGSCQNLVLLVNYIMPRVAIFTDLKGEGIL